MYRFWRLPTLRNRASRRHRPQWCSRDTLTQMFGLRIRPATSTIAKENVELHTPRRARSVAGVHVVTPIGRAAFARMPNRQPDGSVRLGTPETREPTYCTTERELRSAPALPANERSPVGDSLRRSSSYLRSYSYSSTLYSIDLSLSNQIVARRRWRCVVT